jgi:hypothetical protein
MRKLLLAAAAAGVLQGCASSGGGGAPPQNPGGGTVMAIEHTFTGVTSKTFTAPADDVHWAARKALGRMDITVTAETATPEGWKISASATQREIEIDLEHLTPSVTRMRVVADQGALFFKDVATATEVIVQTAGMLDDMKAAQQAAPPKTTAKPKTKAKAKPKPKTQDKPKETI